MKFHFLYHVSFEGPGYLETWIRANHHTMKATHLWEYQTLPAHSDFDFLVVMGGPMSVGDEKEYPWLRDEKRFIEKAVTQKKKVLGICLGAQLLAEVLGGKVYPNPYKEIGWWPVEFLPESQRFGLESGIRPVFQWHGDTFHLPKGALHLAKSSVCENQAFSYGDHVLALQFHLESTPESVRELTRHCKNDWAAGGEYIQTESQIEARGDLFPGLHSQIDSILKKMAVKKRSAQKAGV